MNQSICLQAVLSTANCLYDHHAIQAVLDKMAEKISGHPLSKEKPIFMGVAMGGLFFLSDLTLRLHFPLEFDFIRVSSYQDKMYATELKWQAWPSQSIEGRTVVILDDIIDTGLTLAALIDFCKKQGAKSVFTAVLVDKKVKRAAGGLASANFTGVEVGDKFVFGYGLDYKGFWRNAPGIYELAEEHKE